MIHLKGNLDEWVEAVGACTRWETCQAAMQALGAVEQKKNIYKL